MPTFRKKKYNILIQRPSENELLSRQKKYLFSGVKKFGEIWVWFNVRKWKAEFSGQLIVSLTPHYACKVPFRENKSQAVNHFENNSLKWHKEMLLLFPCISSMFHFLPVRKSVLLQVWVQLAFQDLPVGRFAFCFATTDKHQPCRTY